MHSKRIYTQFGQSFDSMALYPDIHPFGVSFDALTDLMLRRFTDPLWRIKKLFGIGFEGEIAEHLKVINDFSNKLITERRQSAEQKLRDESGDKTFDLFSLYLHHKEFLSNEQMKYIAMNFIIG